MALNKINGFAAPYRSLTFQGQASNIVSRNGLLRIAGNLSFDGPDIVIPPFTFIQQGLIVDVTDERRINGPISAPEPYFVIASVPTTGQTDDLVLGIARTPEQLNELTVVIAQWDGETFNLADLVSNDGIIKFREQDKIDFKQIGPIDGVNTVVTGGGYNNNPGFIIESNGQKQVFDEVAFFPTVDDEPNGWKRIDRVVYRRPTDAPGRRTSDRQYVVGGAYADTGPEAIQLTEHMPAGGDGEGKQQQRVLIGTDNTVTIVFAEGFGTNHKIRFVKYSSDRTTQLVAPTDLVAEASSDVFGAGLDASGNIHVAYVLDGDIRFQKFDGAGANLVPEAVIYDSVGLDPARHCRAFMDPFFQKFYIVFTKVGGPTVGNLFFTSTAIADGAIITGQKQITTGIIDIRDFDIFVSGDQWVYCAWNDINSGQVFFQRFDDIGDTFPSEPNPTYVSGGTDATAVSAGTLVDQADKPKIIISDNKELFVLFRQRSADQRYIAIWTPQGGATIKSWVAAHDFVRDFDVSIDGIRNYLHITIAGSESLRYVKVLPADLSTVHEVELETSPGGLESAGTGNIVGIVDATKSVADQNIYSAQTFQFTNDVQIDSIDIALSLASPATLGGVSVRIREILGASPAGTDPVVANLPILPFTSLSVGAPLYTNIPFAEPIILQGGQTYSLELVHNLDADLVARVTGDGDDPSGTAWLETAAGSGIYNPQGADFVYGIDGIIFNEQYAKVENAFDNLGTMFHAWAEDRSNTFNSVGSTEPIAHIGPSSIVGGISTINITADELLFETGAISRTPLAGERMVISGSANGNDGTYLVESVTDPLDLNAPGDVIVVKITTSFPAAESPAGAVNADFFQPAGNPLNFIKSTAESDEVTALTREVLPSDTLLTRILTPGPLILNEISYFNNQSPGVNTDTFGVYGVSSQLDWEATAAGELTFAGNLHVLDLLNGPDYTIQNGSYPMQEDEAIFITLDGNTGTVVPQIVPLGFIPWADPIFVLGFIKSGEFNPVHLKVGGVGQLDSGESITVGEDLHVPHRAKLGIITETQFEAFSTAALDSEVIAATDSLPTAISKVAVAPKEVFADIVDLESTTLPFVGGVSGVIDGETLVDGLEILFTQSALNGIYRVAGVGTSISYTKLTKFSGTQSPQLGSTVSVKSGTDYLKTQWRYQDATIGWKAVDSSALESEPSGYPNRTDSEISFDNATRTFTIQPKAPATFFDYSIQGKFFRVSGPESIVIPDVNGPNFIYFDNGTLTRSDTFDYDLFKRFAYTAFVYWDQPDQEAIVVADERHGLTMDGGTHRYLHNVFGTQYVGGLTAGNFTTTGDGTADADAQLSVSNGTIFDEDIDVNIANDVLQQEQWDFAGLTGADFDVVGAAKRIDLPEANGVIPYFWFNVADGVNTQSDPAPGAGYASLGQLNMNLADNATAIVAGISIDLIVLSAATLGYFRSRQDDFIKSGTTIGFRFSNLYELTQDGSAADSGTAWSKIQSQLINDSFGQLLDPIAEIPIYYRDGASGTYRKFDATPFPVRVDGTASGRAQYNNPAGPFTVEDVTDNSHVAYWLFATNKINEPVIALMGQREDVLLEDATANNQFGNLLLGDFPAQEWKLIYRLIFQTNDTYTNAVESKLVDVLDLRGGTDEIGVAAPSPNDHAQLSGLNGPGVHPASSIRTGNAAGGPAPFTGGLDPEEDINSGQVFDTLDKRLGQLRIVKHPTLTSRVIITGSDKVLNSGVTVSQELRNLLLFFEGAEIDFVSGEVFESDGTTPLNAGANDFTPATIPTSEFQNYSIQIIPGQANADNTINGGVLVIPGSGTGASKAVTPKAPFGNNVIKIGGVFVQEDGGGIADIESSDIIQLGIGSGSGGSGIDEAALFLEDLKAFGRNEQIPEFLTPNIIPLDGDTKIDPASTGELDVANNVYDLEVGSVPTAVTDSLLVGTDDLVGLSSNTDLVGQAFDASSQNGALVSIRYRMRRTGGPITGNATIKLFRTPASAPQDGPGYLFTESNPIDMSLLTASYQDFIFTFPETVLLHSTGEAYFAAVDGTNLVYGGSTIEFEADNGAGFPSFAAYISNDSGATWSAQSPDLNFEVIVEQNGVDPIVSFSRVYDGSSAGGANDTAYSAQTFFTVDPLFITNVGIALGAKGLPGDVRLEIWGVTGGGEPDSSNVIAVSNTRDRTTFFQQTTLNAAKEMFIFPGNELLSAATEYAVVLISDNANILDIGVVSGNPDPSGTLWFGSAPFNPGDFTAQTTDVYIEVQGISSLGGGGEQFLTTQSFGSRFLSNDQDVFTVYLHALWALGAIDDNALYEVAIDGSTYNEMPMAQVGISGKYTGCLSDLNTTDVTTHEYADSNADLNVPFDNAANQGYAIPFTVTNKERFSQAEWFINKVGSPVGFLIAQVTTVVGGAPGNILSEARIDISTLPAGDSSVVFDTPQVLAPGDYFITLRPSSAYVYDSGVDEINVRVDTSSPTYPQGDSSIFDGTNWAPDTGNHGVFTILGFQYDLRTRITASQESSLIGIGAFYGRRDILSDAAEPFQQRFVLNGDDDVQSIEVTKFIPNPASCKVIDVNTGQVLVWPAIDFSGRNILFAAGQFLSPGETINLLVENGSGIIDNSDQNAGLLAENRFGSRDPDFDRSRPGEGNLLRADHPAAGNPLVEVSVRWNGVKYVIDIAEVN